MYSMTTVDPHLSSLSILLTSPTVSLLKEVPPKTYNALVAAVLTQSSLCLFRKKEKKKWL